MIDLIFDENTKRLQVLLLHIYKHFPKKYCNLFKKTHLLDFVGGVAYGTPKNASTGFRNL